MFNAHLSFIKAMIGKGYFDATAYLLKKGAIYDMDCWKFLKAEAGGYGYHSTYTEFLKMFFLLGLGCGDEKEVTDFLKQDKAFAMTVLSDLSTHLYQNSYDDRSKYKLNGALPMPFEGVQVKLVALYNELLKDTKLQQVVRDRDSFILPEIGNNSYDSEGNTIEHVSSMCVSSEVQDIMRDYALMSDARMMFNGNFANFRNFDFATRNSGASYHGTKDTCAFDCSDLSKLKGVLTSMFKASKMYVPKNFVPQLELLVRDQKRNKDSYHGEVSRRAKKHNGYMVDGGFFGLPQVNIYIEKSKLEGKTGTNGRGTHTIMGVTPVICTPRMEKVPNGKLSDFEARNAKAPVTKVTIKFLCNGSDTQDYLQEDVKSKLGVALESLLPDPFEVDLVEITDDILLDGVKLIENKEV